MSDQAEDKGIARIRRVCIAMIAVGLVGGVLVRLAPCLSNVIFLPLWLAVTICVLVMAGIGGTGDDGGF